MQKNVLKHQFENFSTASNESLDKAYDRFQKTHKSIGGSWCSISKGRLNQKFLRSLPPSWNQIAIMRNKPDIDEIDIDDLYNNLRVYEDEMKRSSSSFCYQSLASFLSSENTSSTNEVSIASEDFGVSIAGGSNQVSSTPCAHDVACSFFAQPTTSPQLENEDFQQIDEDDLEELDLRWQVAMLTVKALVAQDGLGGYDWSNDFEIEPVNYALMAISSLSSSSSSNNKEESSKNLDELLNSQISVRDKTGLGYGTQLNEMSNNSETDSEISLSVFYVRSSDEESTPANDRSSKVDGYHAVPPPITGNFLTPRADISFAGLITPVKQNEKKAVHKVSTARPVSIARPVSTARPISTVRPFSPKIAQTSGAIRPIYPRMDNVRMPKGNYLDHVSKRRGSLCSRMVGNPEILLQDLAVVDSGCSSHMTGNKAYLLDYEDFNGGFVAFGSDPKGEAVICACYVLNRGAPLWDHLNTLDSLGKFDGKSNEGYLLEYSTSSKAFRVYNKRTKRVEENLHINFLKDQPNVTGTGPNWMFDLDFLTNSMNYIPVSVENQVNVDAGTQDSYVAGSSGKDKGPTQEYILLPLQPHRTRILVEDVALAAHEKPSETLDDATRQAFEKEKRNIASQKKVAQATSTNILSTVSTATTPYVSAASTPIGTNAGESSFVYLGGKIPINASTLPNVDLPIDPNMLNLEDASDTLPNDRIFNGAYDDDEDLVEWIDFLPTWITPLLTKVIGTKWVFRNKRDERSIVVKNKAWLIAQGFRQEEGIDYDEVFALIARLRQLGFVDPAHPNKVYKVIKALYGLHQAPRAWYETLSSFLMENGFRRGTIDKILFIKKKKSDIITATTPIESNKPLVKDEDGIDVDVHIYRSMIGSLMYLIASRPNIMFAVCACVRFQVTPKASHLNAVKRIFSYIEGRQDEFLYSLYKMLCEQTDFANGDVFHSVIWVLESH
ncbi:reverse transcriptase domain-containing protein [Tanacetum coccineum]